MVRLLRVCIGRIAAPLPHDESAMAVVLKQDEQVTGLKSRRTARRHLCALHGLPKTLRDAQVHSWARLIATL